MEPRFLYLETCTHLLSLSSLFPPFFKPCFHSAPPPLVTTATGEGQKTKGVEKCADERISQLKITKFGAEERSGCVCLKL